MPRGKNEHTKDYLARTLREAGLTQMADKAATGYYHDFLSPLSFPEMQLETDLRAARDACPEHARRVLIEQIRQAHVSAGEFDADLKESDEWAAGPEGQDAFRRLISGK